jgi:hypothetical protein
MISVYSMPYLLSTKYSDTKYSDTKYSDSWQLLTRPVDDSFEAGL